MEARQTHDRATRAIATFSSTGGAPSAVSHDQHSSSVSCMGAVRRVCEPLGSQDTSRAAGGRAGQIRHARNLHSKHYQTAVYKSFLLSCSASNTRSSLYLQSLHTQPLQFLYYLISFYTSVKMSSFTTLSIVSGIFAALGIYVYLFGIPKEWKRALEKKALRAMGENKASYMVQGKFDPARRSTLYPELRVDTQRRPTG